MRTLLFSLVLWALPTLADDDGYYQRQFEARQVEQRQYDTQLVTRQLESRRVETQRVEQQRVRRQQDRADQEQTDARWEAQQRRSGVSMPPPLPSGGRGAAIPRHCSELRLPQDQRVLTHVTGYFLKGYRPYFMSVLQFGEDASLGYLSLRALVHDGALPTEVRPAYLELQVTLKQPSGKTRVFKAVSGSATFEAAQQRPSSGQMAVAISGLTLVEQDDSGFRPRVGGACLTTARFNLNSSWKHPELSP